MHIIYRNRAEVLFQKQNYEQNIVKNFERTSKLRYPGRHTDQLVNHGEIDMDTSTGLSSSQNLLIPTIVHKLREPIHHTIDYVTEIVNGMAQLKFKHWIR